jgi:hypothetical protein
LTPRSPTHRRGPPEIRLATPIFAMKGSEFFKFDPLRRHKRPDSISAPNGQMFAFPLPNFARAGEPTAWIRHAWKMVGSNQSALSVLQCTSVPFSQCAQLDPRIKEGLRTKMVPSLGQPLLNATVAVIGDPEGPRKRASVSYPAERKLRAAPQQMNEPRSVVRRIPNKEANALVRLSVAIYSMRFWRLAKDRGVSVKSGSLGRWHGALA